MFCVQSATTIKKLAKEKEELMQQQTKVSKSLVESLQEVCFSLNIQTDTQILFILFVFIASTSAYCMRDGSNAAICVLVLVHVY